MENSGYDDSPHVFRELPKIKFEMAHHAGQIDITASLHHYASMRTTLNLSEEAHGMALSFARDQRISLSEAVNRLLLQPASNTPKPRKKRKTGLPTFDCIRKVGSHDVRQLEDDL